MNLRDKKAWLRKHGHVHFNSNNEINDYHTVQWFVYGKAFLFTGRGADEDKAYENLYTVVIDTLYGICK